MAHPKYRTKQPRREELKTVPAGRSRNRLILLSQKGIGRKAVHECTGLDHRTLARIKNGKTRYVRKESRDLIFSVPFNAHSDMALIDSSKTQKLISRLLTQDDMGFTRSEIARRLNPKVKARCKPGYATLEIGRKGRVLARSQMKVERLWNDANGIGAATEDKILKVA